jgi:HD-like signal output (HDOD) protein
MGRSTVVAYDRSPSKPPSSRRGGTGTPTGHGVYELPSGELLAASTDEIVRRVVERFHRPDYVPPVLPTVAIEMLAMSREPDVELRRVAAAIEREPMLAARMLRLAQTPLYAGRAPVRSVDDALRRMGLSRVTQLVLEISTTRVFRAPGYEAELTKLQRHSQATAHIARRVAAQAGQPVDYAFLCGLLHDVGIAAIAVALADVPRGQKPPPFESVWPGILDAHEEISGLIGKLWGFAPELQVVLAHHHGYRIADRFHPLAAVVFVAGTLASEYGADADEIFGPRAISTAAATLGIEGALDDLRAEAKAIVDAIPRR